MSISDRLKTVTKKVNGKIVSKEEIVDEEGRTMVSYKYDAWGQIIKEVRKEEEIGRINNIVYKGYYLDKETGWYYLNSRYYDPEIGRFISGDDYNYLDINEVGSLNLFAYCNNNPVMYLDSNGNYPQRISIIGNVIQGFLEGMSRYLENSTKGMSLTLQQAKKIARKGGHFQSARSIIRGREDDIAQSLKMSGKFSSIAKWTGIALLVLDIGSSWVNNYNSGSSTWVTDSIVDTGYSLVKYGLGSVIFSTSMLIPGVGWIVGIGLSMWADDLLDHHIEGEVLDGIKDYVNDLGNNISKGWNHFWSFSWI